VRGTDRYHHAVHTPTGRANPTTTIATVVTTRRRTARLTSLSEPREPVNLKAGAKSPVTDPCSGRNPGDDLAKGSSPHLAKPTSTSALTSRYSQTPTSWAELDLVHTKEVVGSVPPPAQLCCNGAPAGDRPLSTSKGTLRLGGRAAVPPRQSAGDDTSAPAHPRLADPRPARLTRPDTTTPADPDRVAGRRAARCRKSSAGRAAGAGRRAVSLDLTRSPHLAIDQQSQAVCPDRRVSRPVIRVRR
jgi:hypothetical protein